MPKWTFTVKVGATLVALSGLATFVTATHGVEPASTENKPAAAPSGKALPHDPSLFVGTSSCTAVSCHGGNPKQGVHHAEYSAWLQKDRHAQAYNVLFNEVSVRMKDLLRLEKPAHESQLCLNCHAPVVSDAPFPTEFNVEHHQDVVSEGVSCEACHGAASQWLRPHIRSDWTTKPDAEKEKLGFKNTKNLWQRAKLCADCHVGAPGRDVNHDLYAAGHPRLSFELSAFHALMPAHWDRRKDQARAAGVALNAASDSTIKSPLEVKLWGLGQLASAEAALELLNDRASKADKVGELPQKYPSAAAVPAWPELAETACFACHHDLASPSWRQARGYSNRKPGAYPWGTWLFPLIPQAAGLAGGDIKRHEGSLATLTTEMAKPVPNVATVKSQSAALREQIEKLAGDLQAKSLTQEQVGQLFAAIAKDGGELSQQSWDEATQVYLALVALNRGHRDLSGQPGSQAGPCRETISALCELRQVLEFPEGYDSPLHYLRKSDENLVEKLNQIQKSFEGK